MADKYVSPTGSDGAAGSEAAPYLTIQKGLENVSNGETVWLRGNAGSFVAQNVTSSGSSGASGSEKLVKAYPGEQAVIAGRLNWDNAVDHVYFIGHEDVRVGRTADTIKIVNNNNSQHAVEMYGTNKKLYGCEISKSGSYLGSCVAMGWNGSAGQYLADSCILEYCWVRDVGTDPSYTNSDSGHDHGVYLNYDLNCVVRYNVFENIQGGWGIHCYTESGSARHVDGSSIHHNTVYDTRDGGIMLASDGNSTTKNTVADSNLYSDCGNTVLTQGAYSMMVFWGGPTGTGNTGDSNHSYNPADGDVMPGITGFTITNTSNGDPLFTDAAGHDFRLQAGSPAEGTGAFPTIDGNIYEKTGLSIS